VDPWKAMLELEGVWAGVTDEHAQAIWGDEVPDGPNAQHSPLNGEPLR
jgi:hypothetical protein